MSESGGPNWYDVLDVDPGASEAEVRAAWKHAIADLGPTDRRFRLYNQAAEVLLDPQRRREYDAGLAVAEAEPDPAPITVPAPATVPDQGRAAEPPAEPAGARPPAPRVVPAWLLAGLAVLTLALAGGAAYLWTTPSDTEVEASTRAAQSAAERAIVPILSYSHETLDDDQAAAQAYMTSDYREEYDKLFEVIRENAPRTETTVEVEVVASGIVRSGESRAEVLLFVNRPTTNKQQREPVVYKDQVRVQLQKVDDDWLVDCLITSPGASCD